jgi:hypothetical protein
MKYWFVMLMIATSLFGCSTTKTQTVTVVKNVYVEVPSELTTPCSATAPPGAQEYELLSTYNKERHLVTYTTALLQDIAVCSNQIVKIGQWNEEQRSVFSKQNKEVHDEHATELRSTSK